MDKHVFFNLLKVNDVYKKDDSARRLRRRSLWMSHQFIPFYFNASGYFRPFNLFKQFIFNYKYFNFFRWHDTRMLFNNHSFSRVFQNLNTTMFSICTLLNISTKTRIFQGRQLSRKPAVVNYFPRVLNSRDFLRYRQAMRALSSKLKAFSRKKGVGKNILQLCNSKCLSHRKYTWRLIAKCLRMLKSKLVQKKFMGYLYCMAEQIYSVVLNPFRLVHFFKYKKGRKRSCYRLFFLLRFFENYWRAFYEVTLLRSISSFTSRINVHKKNDKAELLEGFDVSQKRVENGFEEGVSSSKADEFFGVKFLGASLFNLYILLFLSNVERFLAFRRFVHFYMFFFNTIYSLYESIFFSFYLNKFIRRFMQGGGKFVVETILFSVSSILKLYVGLPFNTILFGSILALRSTLAQTFVFLAGRSNTVPTPSVLDKQLKTSIRSLVLSLQKRVYLKDVVKRVRRDGKLIGQRTPVYKKVTRLCSVLLRVQNFFVNLAFTNLEGGRLLKTDAIATLKKTLYTFVIQRTYMQYRWR